MNNRTRHILAIIGTVLLFLMAVLPVFADEEVRFIDPDDINPDGTLSDNTPDTQEWARQGGHIGLMLFDDDLDQPIKRVVIPSIDATMIGTGDVAAHSATISNASSSVTASLSAGDYVLIGQNTVRKVESVDGNSSVTLDNPFARGMASATIYRIDDSVTGLAVWDDNYSSYAMAEVIDGATLRPLGNGYSISRYRSRHAIADSNVASSVSGSSVTALDRLSGSGTGSINTDDVLVVKVSGATSTSIQVDDVSGDRVEMDDVPGASDSNPLGLASNETAYLVYWAEERNETGSVVTINSQVRPSPVTVVLTESTPRSGTFVLEIATVAPLDQHGNLIVADTSAVPPTLPVNLRDAVTMSAADVSDALELESTPPSFSNFNPPHNTAVRDRRPEVSAHVTDRESGLVDRNIHVTFRITEGSRTRTVELTPRYDGDVSPVPGGFEVRQRLPGAHAPAGDATIEWWVSAKDNAGNIGHSSNESSSVLIDSARSSLLRAETGRHWDPSLVTGDSDDKTEYRASRADPTSVLVVFDEHLDGATVTAADFEVDGDRPAAAAVRNVTVRGDSRGGDGNSDIAGDDVLDVGLPRGYVFLTVDEMSPDSRPRVELVGEVSDLAGNRTRTGRNNEAYDRTAPALTVARAGGDTTPAYRVRTNTTISMTATFSETVFGFESSDISVGNGKAGNIVASGANSVYSFDVTPTAIGNVTVEVPAGVTRDAAGNGNSAAAQVSLGIPYDDDFDGTISRSEVINAIDDYLFGGGPITRAQIVALIGLYLFG